MRTGPLIVSKIALQSTTQRPLIPHDNVVQALASDGAHESFQKRILPRGSRRGEDFLYPHISGHVGKVSSCSLASFLGVPKQLARQGGFSGRSRMLRRGALGRILSWPVRYSDLRLAPDYAESLERGTAQAATMARAFGIIRDAA
jgi:hypothetical protein